MDNAGGWWWNRDDMTVRELDQMKSRELNNGRLAMCAAYSGSQGVARGHAASTTAISSSTSARSACSAQVNAKCVPMQGQELSPTFC